MPDASVAVTLDVDFPYSADERTITYRGKLAVDAAPDTYAAAGLTVDLRVNGINHSAPPIEFRVWSEKGTTTEYTYEGRRGATIATNKVAIYEGGGAAPHAEISGAIPAGVSGNDALYFAATFVKGT